MARTSKRKVRLESQSLQENVSVKTYMAGIYARLSVDNHDGKEISIETQIEMAKEYLKSHTEITLYDCYSDLGATGTNFQRSDFERLMQDVRDGLINCIIVKDFSRFGRNYIETGNFVEKIFPFLGVRFIAITDQYDSIKQADCNEALSMHLKNIANELYARDIAEKVTASKQAKMKQGEYLGSIPPYGFQIEKIDGKRTLVPEPVTSEIVREIFNRYASGETFVSLAKWLYGQKIHRPSDYKKYKMVYQQEGQQLRQWERESIRFLLTNDAYIGNLVQSGKHMKEQITAEHTHEPLVSEEVFYRVWERIEENIKIQNRRPLRKDTMEDIFRGVLYCGECGHKLSRMVTERKASYKEVKTFVFYSTASKQAKMKQGEYLGSIPPYGFQIEKIDGKRTLVPEPVTSEIVREIFNRYASGETFVSLAKWLYGQKIHRPSDYKKYKMVYQQEGQQLRQWERESIRFLLTNDAYIGNLVQSGKHMKEQITAEHTHEPLVSEEVFYRVWKNRRKY